MLASSVAHPESRVEARLAHGFHHAGNAESCPAMASSLVTLSADSSKPLNCFNLQQMSEADSIGDRSGNNLLSPDDLTRMRLQLPDAEGHQDLQPVAVNFSE
jgi:hypothetical protein